jgi:hypothetical protein
MTQQPDQPAPHVQATRYTVNCMPEGLGPGGHVFEITVEYRGNGRWTVVRHRQELDADGAWSYKPGWPDGQEPTDDAGWDAYYAAVDAWTAAHRHDRDTALRLAREAAPHVTVMGAPPADALARIARLNAEESSR